MRIVRVMGVIVMPNLLVMMSIGLLVVREV